MATTIRRKISVRFYANFAIGMDSITIPSVLPSLCNFTLDTRGKGRGEATLANNQSN